jgi:hypothetical protein
MCTLLLCVFYFGLVLLLAHYPLKDIPRLFCQLIVIIADKPFSWVRYLETTSVMIPKRRGLLLNSFYILAKLDSLRAGITFTISNRIDNKNAGCLLEHREHGDSRSVAL